MTSKSSVVAPCGAFEQGRPCATQERQPTAPGSSNPLQATLRDEQAVHAAERGLAAMPSCPRRRLRRTSGGEADMQRGPSGSLWLGRGCCRFSVCCPTLYKGPRALDEAEAVNERYGESETGPLLRACSSASRVSDS